MKLIEFVGLVSVLLLPGFAVCAERPQPGPRVGDTYEITRIRESSQQGENGSSGSSHDKDTLIERVIGVRADGLELEYDLPKAQAEGARNWQFPARVFKVQGQPPQLLNRTELETRLVAWLKAAKLPRAACGHWIFTWNGFRIECDPQTVIETIELFDLNAPDLREGAPYQATEALRPAPLVMKAAGPTGAIFTAEMDIDPDKVRRAQAETDIGVAEILHKPLTLEAALQERMKEAVTGTITVTFDVNAGSGVRRETKVTELKIKGADGELETTAITETIERRRLSGRAAHR